MLKVSEETVRRWIRSDELEAEHDGKAYLIDEEVLNKFVIKKSKVSGTSLSKMAAYAATAALPLGVVPIVGGALLKMTKESLKNTSNQGHIKENEVYIKEPSFGVKDIEDYIESLYRKKKKLELEYQMNLLEIEEELAKYNKLKDQLEIAMKEDEK